MKNKQEFATSEDVYDRALTLLGLREHGGADMYEKLLLKGATEEQAKMTVAKLKQVGLIDELRYGMAVYHSWLSKGCFGKQHLIGILTKKLVDKSVWEQILAEFTDEMEAEHAQKAAEIFLDKYKNKKFDNRKKLWATAAGFMVNRGFGANYMDLVLSNFTQMSDN